MSPFGKHETSGVEVTRVSPSQMNHWRKKKLEYQNSSPKGIGSHAPGVINNPIRDIGKLAKKLNLGNSRMPS